ncbi:MAG: hypothetical protein OXO54_12705 [Chloroflexota bacterium]|nr:hypothetical protein [Chloroflexota bacterium]MDE2899171.1 hypothetical protein [Chloroflexota bacterium]
MSANPLAHDDPYCPRCFRLVLNDYVFCQYCGQFIHQNAPADSRPWDTRPPEIPAAAPVVAPEAPSIDLPEDALPYAAAGGAAGDEAPTETTNIQPPEPADAPKEKTDTESA